MTIANRINKRARELNLSQSDIAKKISISKGAVNQWFKGTTKPNGKNLLNLAKALETSATWIERGEENYTYGQNKQKPHTIKEAMPNYPVPILNTVQAGEFTDIAEDQEGLGYDLVTPDLKDCFALKIVGDSMQPILNEGMIAYIRPQATANNGDIVVAQINCDTEATVKRLRTDAGVTYLVPENNKYDPIKITESLSCRIIGVVVSAKINF